jgi:hypothetical protein
VVGLAGAVGGALNATLCYLEWPEKVHTFEWHVIPAGCSDYFPSARRS